MVYYQSTNNPIKPHKILSRNDPGGLIAGINSLLSLKTMRAWLVRLPGSLDYLALLVYPEKGDCLTSVSYLDFIFLNFSDQT